MTQHRPGGRVLDVNCFQHKPYLESFAKDRGLSLAPITQVPTGPMGLYAGKLGIWEGGERGKHGRHPERFPNQARALLMLQDLGWLSPPGINPPASEVRRGEEPHNLAGCCWGAQLPLP